MSAISKIKDKLKEYIITEFKLKGHNLTGSFIDSLEVDYDNYKFTIKGNAYGINLNDGVKASNIPYSGRSGAGGSSKYITGLKNYVKERMGISDERKALSIAFAIATKHSRDGIDGSGFIDDALDKINKNLDNLILDYLDEQIKY